MKQLIMISVLALFAVGCSSAQKRTKWTDKNMRVMIDPDSLSATDYVGVQTSLVQDSSFTVIDRGQGFRAVKKEQERSHRNEVDRYEDKEKWAHWGKLYGIGAVVVGHKQCFRTKKFFSMEPYVNRCKQFLSMVDANTGEVIVAVEGKSDQSIPINAGSFQEPSNWGDVVELMVEAYPKEYRKEYYSEGLMHYSDLSKEEAIRQREVIAKERGE